MDLIQDIHKWTANILIIIFIYSSMMWYWIGSQVEKINNVSFQALISLEKLISSLMFILGVGVLISNPEWLSKKGVLLKIMLGIITVGLIHTCALKTKRYVEKGTEGVKEVKTLNILRGITILFLMTVYTTGTMIRAYNDQSILEEAKQIYQDED